MTQVATTAAAAASTLPFAVVYPAHVVVPPLAVWVSKADPLAPNDPRVILDYDTSSAFGAFRIIERQPPPGSHSPTFIQDLAAVCESCSDHRLVDLGNGAGGALLAGAPGPTSVTWLQGPWEVIVIGPAATFTEAHAVTISQGLVSGPASSSSP